MPENNLPANVESNLPVIPASPEEIINIGHDLAVSLVKAVEDTKTVVMVRGQKYLRYEHWQLLGTFAKAIYGGFVGSKAYDAEPIERDGKVIGFRAKAVALLNGEEVAGAIAYCYRSEKNKEGESRWRKAEDFQIASMSQTRACSKSLRNFLAWIVLLGGGTYQTTTAEEMEHEQDDGKPATSAAKSTPQAKSKPAKVDTQREKLQKEIVAIGTELGLTEIEVKEYQKKYLDGKNTAEAEIAKLEKLLSVLLDVVNQKATEAS